jgi:DNA-binding transcriptional regulator of glucitol operon
MLTNQSSGVTRMGLLNRDRHVDEDRVLRDDEVVDRPADRNRYARSVVRALFTLAGVAVAGLLIWIASNFDLGQTSEFWAVMGLLAGAGLALGLSQLLGGWTKWGVPRVSAAVLLLAWLPTLVAAGWILLAAQPTGGWQQSRFESWSDTIGILGFVRDQGPFAAAIALACGVVTAFIFDTTGPRERHVERTRTVADEDVHDYRREDGATIAVPTDRPTTTVDDRETVTTGARDDSVVPAGTRDDTVVRRDTP